MKNLKSLITDYKKVYIQPHNFPDADAIASAWGMKRIAEKFGAEAEVIYYGNNIFKPNIDNLINKYQIKMTVIGEGFEVGSDELLIIVDGQYGAGNMMAVKAVNIASIDHHIEERSFSYLFRDIQPKVGACASLIYSYLKEYNIEIDEALGTILYYGIFMDTDMFTGKTTTLDNDAKKGLEVIYDKKVIDFLRLSSMSFDDLQIYAEGILKTERYNNIIFSNINECDDNLLGHISDLLSELNGIDIVIVYSPRNRGFKLSVRSYHDYITADEIVKDITDGVGSGGGHQHKAGGFISNDRFDKVYSKVSIGIYIRTRVIDYCREIRLLKTGTDDPFEIYGKGFFFKAKKKKIYLRYIDICDFFNETVTVKTLEGVTVASPKDKVIIGVKNEIWPVAPKVFERKYETVDGDGIECISEAFLDDYGITVQSDTNVLRINKDNIKDCKVCLTSDDAFVQGIKLNMRIKVRTGWGDLFGKAGDYLLINSIDDYYICDADIFHQTYEIL